MPGLRSAVASEKEKAARGIGRSCQVPVEFAQGLKADFLDSLCCDAFSQ